MTIAFLVKTLERMVPVPRSANWTVGVVLRLWLHTAECCCAENWGKVLIGAALRSMCILIIIIFGVRKRKTKTNQKIKFYNCMTGKLVLLQAKQEISFMASINLQPRSCHTKDES